MTTQRGISNRSVRLERLDILKTDSFRERRMSRKPQSSAIRDWWDCLDNADFREALWWE